MCMKDVQNVWLAPCAPFGDADGGGVESTRRWVLEGDRHGDRLDGRRRKGAVDALYTVMTGESTVQNKILFLAWEALIIYLAGELPNR
jgi:hypothetical protein